MIRLNVDDPEIKSFTLESPGPVAPNTSPVSTSETMRDPTQEKKHVHSSVNTAHVTGPDYKNESKLASELVAKNKSSSENKKNNRLSKEESMQKPAKEEQHVLVTDRPERLGSTDKITFEETVGQTRDTYDLKKTESAPHIPDMNAGEAVDDPKKLDTGAIEHSDKDGKPDVGISEHGEDTERDNSGEKNDRHGSVASEHGEEPDKDSLGNEGPEAQILEGGIVTVEDKEGEDTVHYS